jgi:hypothetical protein
LNLWITSEFIRIRVDSIGDETSFAVFGLVSGKKTAQPWASPGPPARLAGPLARLHERKGREGLARLVWKEDMDLAQGSEKNRKTFSFFRCL